MDIRDIRDISNLVRQTAFDIHAFHGNGHLERVYGNALAHRLTRSGVRVVQQHPIRVFDEDGTLLGDYIADLLAEQTLIVELKAVRTLRPEHAAQMLAYLKSTRIEHGLLINFGSYRFEIRKFALNPARRRSIGSD
ncbi:GxxExxY protein [Povalibacter sp.]|uniref:GxxExxY protein n=1 Tax=Povalibacter sp. TaxID=1962978 RepID=UPI002F41286C